MADEAFTEQVVATIAGAARMAAAGGGDVVRLTSPPDDWLDAWDPAYIRTTLPALRARAYRAGPGSRVRRKPPYNPAD